MVSPHARNALLEDVVHVAENLRDADRLEMMLLHGADCDIRMLMIESFAMSDACWAIIYNDEPIGVFGVAPLTKGWGAPWLLGTSKLPRITKSFIKHCPKYVARMLTIHPQLLNYVHAGNDVSIQWLKHLGFTVFPQQKMGVARAPFHAFVKTSRYG